MQQTTTYDLVEQTRVLVGEILRKGSLGQEGREILSAFSGWRFRLTPAELLQGFDNSAVERKNRKAASPATQQLLDVKQISGVQAIHENLDRPLPVSFRVECKGFPVLGFVVS